MERKSAALNQDNVLTNAPIKIIKVNSANNSFKKSSFRNMFEWNLDDIYASKEAFDKDVDYVKNELAPAVQKFEGKLSDPQTILDCLKKSDYLDIAINKIYLYVYLKSDLNEADSRATEEKSKVLSLYSDISSNTAFVNPELLSMSEENLKQISENPLLKEYKFLIENLMQAKKHILSKDEEKLIAMYSEILGSPKEIYSKLSTADLKLPEIKDDKGEMVQLTPTLYRKAVEHPDREFRKRAFDGYFNYFEEHKNTFAQTLASSVSIDVISSKSRKYNSSLEMSLSNDHVPTDVYSNLILSANKNLDSLHKYIETRSKVMNLDKVHNYDLYSPLVELKGSEIPFNKAKKLTACALQPLGQEYLKIFNRAFNENWIDVFERPHKNDGAYNIGVYNMHPYVLLNYNDSFDSLSTFAHEMGHAVNSVYANSNQPYQYSRVSVFNAEIASTVNEILLQNYMINNAKTDEEKIFYLDKAIENIRGSFFTQIMYSEFEKDIHERVEMGEALSADYLNEKWGLLQQKYFGEAFHLDPLARVSWARIPHFYRAFYVYKYASSLVAANEIVNQITIGSDEEKLNARNRYIEFLKSGSSNYPIELLKKAGVDLTSSTPVDSLTIMFTELIDQMEKLLRNHGKLE